MGKGISFVVGAAVGAAAALLLSPNSGERNRELVTEKVGYYSTHGEELFQKTAGTVRDKVRDAGEEARPAADDIRIKINEARDRIADQVTRNHAVQDVEVVVDDVEEPQVETVAPEEAAPAE